ncbi:MAG: hypothetical protein NT178_16545 [Proteobacteria bacterium]|nr:hypothetical protein [Pseudomonadota bacterium]
MAQFKAFSQSVEVNGETVLSVLTGMGFLKQKGIDILEKHGIHDPAPGQWYLQQNWLDAFKDIAESVGNSTLNVIGSKIPENAQFPPEINSLEKALSAIDIAYHMNHRSNGRVMFDPNTGQKSEGIGHYGYEQVGDRRVKMVCENPYPCDFDRGIIEAMVRRFQPSGSSPSVRHDDAAPCRKKGAASCTFLVEW